MLASSLNAGCGAEDLTRGCRGTDHPLTGATVSSLLVTAEPSAVESEAGGMAVSTAVAALLLVGMGTESSMMTTGVETPGSGDVATGRMAFIHRPGNATSLARFLSCM